jgi:hypothetical protein
LDFSAPVYDLKLSSGSNVAHAERNLSAYVSHFSVCPKANDFSKKSDDKPKEPVNPEAGSELPLFKQDAE